MNKIINIIGWLIIFCWTGYFLFLLYVLRLSKCSKQNFIKSLSSSIMKDKISNYENIVIKNKAILEKFKQVKKELVYSISIASVSLIILALIPGELLRNFPKVIFIYALLAILLLFFFALAFEQLINIIIKRVEKEIIGRENE